MSRLDCISNRNIKIIAAYVKSRIGSCQSLFDGLRYPEDQYHSPEDFFLNEDEWTTYDNFERIFRKGKELVGEPDFFFKCGASSASLRSWGRFHYFVRVFASPNDGFRRVPFFNKNFDDTKDIEVILPPVYNRRTKKIRTLLKVRLHDDIDPHREYIGDLYTRGILSSIPTIWGLPPAVIRQIMTPYNPEILLNMEPELIPYALHARIEGGFLTLKGTETGPRLKVGKKVLLEPESVDGQEIFLGKWSEIPTGFNPSPGDQRQAILITETFQVGSRTLLMAGDIYMAPYFILDVSYDRLSIYNRVRQIFRMRSNQGSSGQDLIETLNQLRISMSAKNQAYLVLEKTNEELTEAKARLDAYNKELENRIEERTSQLRKAQQDLLRLNCNLEEKVQAQVIELEKHNQLRRYLSPKLAEKILNSEDTGWTQPQRKMMTVVFTDIRGFSSLTDSLEPEELFQLLNSYHSEMIRIVHDYDGTLNKIVGDGLLIFFGDPIPMDDHADRAVRMAMDMQRKVAELSDEWDRYGHRLGVGIGINSGFATVGNIGSDAYSDYTVIGNQVNVASRLETIAGPGQILISQRTYYALKDTLAVQTVGDIEVKGMHTPVKTYCVMWQ
jgi:adenylate cyclase